MGWGSAEASPRPPAFPFRAAEPELQPRIFGDGGGRAGRFWCLPPSLRLLGDGGDLDGTVSELADCAVRADGWFYAAGHNEGSDDV